MSYGDPPTCGRLAQLACNLIKELAYLHNKVGDSNVEHRNRSSRYQARKLSLHRRLPAAGNRLRLGCPCMVRGQFDL